MIRGERTSLREVRPEDEAMLSALRNDLDTQRMLLARPRPNTIDRVRGWVAAMGADERAVLFVIADAATEEGVGFVQIAQIDVIDGHGHLGIAVDPAHRRRGYAAEAIQLVGAYVHTVFGLHKLLLEVMSENQQARDLYLAAGFREVGTMAEHFRDGERFHDVVLMERIESR